MTERYWRKFHPTLTKLGWEWQSYGNEVELKKQLDSGIHYSCFIPTENFAEEVFCFADNFDEEEYAAEKSYEYDSDVDLDSLIAEGNEVKELLYDLAYELRWVNEK